MSQCNPPRIEFVSEKGMHATVTFGDQDGKDDDNCIAVMFAISSLRKAQEFQALLRRGLNTNDEAPRWLFDLCDALEDKPIPKATARAPKFKSGQVVTIHGHDGEYKIILIDKGRHTLVGMHGDQDICQRTYIEAEIELVNPQPPHAVV